MAVCDEFGLASFSQKSTYMEPMPFHALYDQTIEEVQLAEELGFDSVWMGEHHFSYEGQCPTVWPALARLLAATERIKIGASVLLLPFHTAERVAHACAALQSISPGRLRLAMGTGYRELEFGAHEVDRTQRGALRRARMEELRSAPYAELMGPTEIWMGGEAKPVLRHAVAYGAPLLVHADLPHFKVVKQVVDEELAAGNGTMPKLGVIREVWVEEDPVRARWFRRRYAELWHHYAGIANAESPFQTVATSAKVDVKETGTGPGITTQDPMDIADMAIIGPPDEVAERLWEFVDAGAEALVFHVRVGGMPTAALQENLRRLATEVIPSIRGVVR